MDIKFILKHQVCENLLEQPQKSNRDTNAWHSKLAIKITIFIAV